MDKYAMQKVIRSNVREVVLNVKKYFLNEKRFKSQIIPFGKVNERVAAATGISLTTITKITNERKLAEDSSSSNKVITPMDNFDVGIVQRKIHESYKRRKEIPTVKKLQQILKEEVGFQGSRKILSEHIKKIGFRFKNTLCNKKVLIDVSTLKKIHAEHNYTNILKKEK